MEVVKNISGVETIHSFGVVDTVKSAVWTYETTVVLESFKNYYYFRINVSAKAREALISKGFPVKYSTISAKDIESAILFLRQFESCWLGEIGDLDSRGSISRFIDKNIFKKEWIACLNNMPVFVEDIYRYRLECIRDRHGEYFIVNQIKNKNSSRAITNIPRTSISEIIKLFEDYKQQ